MIIIHICGSYESPIQPYTARNEHFFLLFYFFTHFPNACSFIDCAVHSFGINAPNVFSTICVCVRVPVSAGESLQQCECVRYMYALKYMIYYTCVHVREHAFVCVCVYIGVFIWGPQKKLCTKCVLNGKTEWNA